MLFALERKWMDPVWTQDGLGMTRERPWRDPGWTMDGPGMDTTHLYLIICISLLYNFIFHTVDIIKYIESYRQTVKYKSKQDV